MSEKKHKILNRRSWFIELFRFVLIILLVLFHIKPSSYSTPYYFGDNKQTEKIIFCFFNGWDITIVCLMLITGYYTCGKNNKNVLVRSILTVFFYFILIFSTLMLIKLCQSKKPDWQDIFTVWGEWWYITLWPLVLLISPVLSKIIRYNKFFSLLISLMIWFVATTHANRSDCPPESVYVFNDWRTVYLFLSLVSYYCFGGWIKNYVLLSKKLILFLSGFACLLFYLSGALLSYYDIAYSPFTYDYYTGQIPPNICYYPLWIKLSILSWQSLFPLLVGFTLTIFIFSLEGRINSTNFKPNLKFQSLCLFLGKCSTSIYLIHDRLAWSCIPYWFPNAAHIGVLILLSLSIGYALIVTYPMDMLIKFTCHKVEKIYHKHT